MLNRYRHLLRSDSEAAVSFEPVLLHRLRYIDLRINGTLAMLRDFPELEKEIRPVAISFWKAYRKENTPEALEEEEGAKKSGHLSDEERNERLIRLYKQNFERKHPGAHLAMQLQEAAKGRLKAETTTPTGVVTRKSMVVALKDVLKEDKDSKEHKETQELEEDSDEDQVMGWGMYCLSLMFLKHEVRGGRGQQRQDNSSAGTDHKDARENPRGTAEWREEGGGGWQGAAQGEAGQADDHGQ